MGGSESKDDGDGERTVPFHSSNSGAGGAGSSTNPEACGRGSNGLAHAGLNGGTNNLGISIAVDPKVPLGCTSAAKKRAGIGHPYSGEIAPTGLALAGDPSDKRPFLGFDNFGNTCYANSVLQLLIQNPALKHRLLQIYEQFYGSSAQPNARPIDESVLSRLAELCHHVHHSKKKKGSVGPKELINKIKKENIVFRNSYQQDAHEFMMFVLNDIIESEKKLLGYPINNADVTSPLQVMISGETVSETVCAECETRTTRSEPFLALPVDVEGNRSLTHCVENCSEPEWLQGDDKFKCIPCSSSNIAKRSVKLLEPPPLLFVHMKRFKFVESSGSFKKLAYRIPLADDLGIKFLKYGATLNQQHYLEQMNEIRERANSLHGSTSGAGTMGNRTRRQQKQQQQQMSGTATANVLAVDLEASGGQEDDRGDVTPRFSVLVPPGLQSSGATSANPHRGPVGDDDDVTGLVLDLTTSSKVPGRQIPTPENPYRQQRHPRPQQVAETAGGKEFTPEKGPAGQPQPTPGAPQQSPPEDLVPHITHYRLCGFVIHHGAGLNLGHYIAVHRTEHGGSTWRRFDDETVTVLSDRDVELYFGYAYISENSSTATAYILSYIREDLLTV